MSRRFAAIDVGSNTIHLLVAERHGRDLRDIRHLVVMPRIGKVVQATGSVGAAKLSEVTAEVERMAGVARGLGAEFILLGATEAVRRADDQADVIDALGRAVGGTCRLISPEAEARLSFRGVTSAHGTDGTVLVADIGGASTECILGVGGEISGLASIPVGSGSATEEWLVSDPPTRDERRACAIGVRARLTGAPTGQPATGAVTGGTATTLPILLGRDEGSGTLNAADLDACRLRLGAQPSLAVAAATGIDPARARVLGGGVEIIAAVLERYALDEISVSHQGLRDGMLLAHFERGEDWFEG